MEILGAANNMNKSTGMFFVASLSLILLTSTIAIPLQASAEPDTTKVPVIILFNDKVSNQHKSLVNSHGGEITKSFTIINGIAANLPQTAIDALENNPSIASIHPDLEVHALEVVANGIVGATVVQSPPISKTGDGVKVAILDTGIMQSHPELAGKVKVIDCKSVFSYPQDTCEDQHGHGTHVAGIVGANRVPSTAALGVAPDVDFIIYKVLDKNGSGSFSGIVDAMEYVVNVGGEPRSKVISMSLGSNPINPKNAPNCDGVYPPMDLVMDAAIDAEVVVVAAAGNSGGRGVGLPACHSGAIAVAATNDSDFIASFSSRGGAVEDHGISAPGVSIYSSVPPTGASCCSHPSMYKNLSGTSMATPVVSGSIALLLDANDALTRDQIKTALFTTACNSSSSPSCPTGDTPNKEYGHGRIDVLSAYNFLFPAPIVNVPPTAMPDAYSAEMNSPLSVTSLNGLLANDSDGNGDPLSAIKLTEPSNGGSVTVNSDGGFDYMPFANYVGDETFDYQVSDGNGGTDGETVTITVESPPPNVPPTAMPDAYSIEMNSPLSVISANGVLENDTDGNGDTLTASMQTGPSHSDSFILNFDGSFDYTPVFNYVGDDTFIYEVSDGNGGTDTATVTITVESPPETGSEIIVDSIVYTTEGGRNGDKHLTHTVFVWDGINPVSGASVTITLDNLTIPDSWTGTATTGENGIVSFALKNAPSGCYTTTVDTITGDQLNWDDVTPDNQKPLRLSGIDLAGCPAIP